MVNHHVNQNDKFQIDYLIMLAHPNQLVQSDKVVLYTLVIWGNFLTKKPNKKMNCNSVNKLKIYMANSCDV